MPMQPRPIAETMGPVEPSLRVFMVALLEMAAGVSAPQMVRLICGVSIDMISWTMLTSLFTIANNERPRPARSRRLRGGGPHPEFPPRGDRAARLGFQP